MIVLIHPTTKSGILELSKRCSLPHKLKMIATTKPVNIPTSKPVAPKRLNSAVKIPLASILGLIAIRKVATAVNPAVCKYCG